MELSFRDYRLFYDIKTIDDCSCVAEEVAAGFVSLDEGEQLGLFCQAPRPKYPIQWDTVEVTESDIDIVNSRQWLDN